MAISIVPTVDTGRVDGSGNPLPPRVSLALTWTTAPVQTQVRVRRLDPDGQKRDVRQGSPATLSAGLGTIYDYEAPFDQAVTYYIEKTDGSQVVAQTGTTTLTAGGQVWLIHPGLPENSEAVTVVEWPTWTRPVTRGIFQPLGRKYPIVTSQTRSGEAGTMTVYTDSPTRRADLLRLLDYGVPLMLKGSPDYEDAGWRWVAVGDVDESPVEDGFGSTVTGFTIWTLPLVVVDPPVGTAAAAWAYSNSNAYFTSYADATTKAATYSARSAGF